MNNYLNKYKKTSIESASKEQLLLLMYEGAIKYVKKAIIAIDEKDIAGRGQNIGFAFDIIMELNNTLDHKVGGEIAANLEQLYHWMTNQLTQANISANKKGLEDVLKVLNTLYDGWQQAIEKLKQEAK